MLTSKQKISSPDKLNPSKYPISTVVLKVADLEILTKKLP